MGESDLYSIVEVGLYKHQSSSPGASSINHEGIWKLVIEHEREDKSICYDKNMTTPFMSFMVFQ
jgi:hypothetical protein